MNRRNGPRRSTLAGGGLLVGSGHDATSQDPAQRGGQGVAGAGDLDPAGTPNGSCSSTSRTTPGAMPKVVR